MTIMCFSNITVQRNLRWSNSFYYIGDVYFWCTYPRRIIRLETGWIVTAGDLFCGDAQIFSWLPWLHGSHASLFCVNRIMTAHCQVRNKKIIADSGILVLDAFFQLFSGYLFACSSVKQRFCPYYFHTGWYLYLMPLTKQTRLPTPIF